MFAAMVAKDTPYLASLLALVNAKNSNPELRLAAACAWTALESGKLTKVQIADIKKNRFRGVSIPELLRYAVLPCCPWKTRSAPFPLRSCARGSCPRGRSTGRPARSCPSSPVVVPYKEDSVPRETRKKTLRPRTRRSIVEDHGALL